LTNNIESDTEKHSPSPIETRIDYRGRVYIPVEIRKKLRLKADSVINLRCEDNSIILSPSRRTVLP
jgi:AbrB family looped-hinge helix DNA binding protein